ncbi:MAG TPA: MFS transporter, partial [Acidimicrobiia bacterium]|nr:MFS transporter [Acidimicrobiia bacterium]
LALLPVTAAWIVFAVLAKEPPRPAAPQSSIASLLPEPDARWLCAFYLVTFGGFVGLSGYLPIFFVDRFGLAKVSAASYAALCAAAGSFLRPVGGALADRFGGTTVLTFVLGAVATLGVLLAFLPPLGVSVALLFLTLGALGVGNGAVFQLVPQRFPSRMGAMTGLVGAAGGVGGFLLPFGMGSLVQATGTFGVGFVAFGIAAAVAAVGATGRQRKWRAAWDLEVAV